MGNFVSVIGNVAYVDGNSEFGLYTTGEDTMIVYIDSTTGINLGAVDVGDEYQVISPVVVFNGTIELKPRSQSDLVENPGRHRAGDRRRRAATTTSPLADAADDHDRHHHRQQRRDLRHPVLPQQRRRDPRRLDDRAHVQRRWDIYAGTIPAGHPESQVDYYIEATDDGAQTVTLPGDAPTGFYTVAIGLTTIYDMQYVHPDSSSTRLRP